MLPVMALLVGAVVCHAASNAAAEAPPIHVYTTLQKPIEQALQHVWQETVADYKALHQHPELSLKESSTAGALAKALKKIGAEVHEGIGGYGVVGLLHGKASGPLVLYRLDMDALPVSENTGLAYASKRPGVMHACGHDLHMAVGLGTMRLLAQLRHHWHGTVMVLGQPAEELGTGAKSMLADPRLRSLLQKYGPPRLALALHSDANFAAGDVALLGGFAYANVDEVDITVHGVGAHGARPQEGIDPILIASEIVVALQSIVSRRMPPGEKAVVTVGSFHAGSKHNIIPAAATLQITVRSYGDDSRNKLLQEIRRVAIGVAAAHNAPKEPTMVVSDTFVPAGYNDPPWTERFATLFAQVLGAHRVKVQQPNLGGDDFAVFPHSLKIPGVLYRLGASPQKALNSGAVPGLHSDKFAPDYAPALKTGILTMVAALLESNQN